MQKSAVAVALSYRSSSARMMNSKLNEGEISRKAPDERCKAMKKGLIETATHHLHILLSRPCLMQVVGFEGTSKVGIDQ